MPGYIVPDLLVTDENGQLTVLLADQGCPELKISPYYRQLLHSCGEEPVQEYLSQKLRQADWVVRNLEQRRSTILRIARCIVSRQEEFFRQGPQYLHPLTLADVAADAGVHESTVSRTIRQKYIQCAWGLFPLSRFFSRALPAAGAECSVQQVKALLQALIDCEDKGRPLSDQRLCEALVRQGIDISRRTVAKYRDEMGIPSAPGRKEF